MIGHIVLDGRREAGMTQRQLGALTGLNQSTISRLERGKLPGLSMKNLATIIGVLADRRRASRWRRAA
jgi:transcriptional regulator with XRE-family HTH domain